MLDQLRENGAASVHPPLFRIRNSSFGPKNPFRISNRSRAEGRHLLET
jgi:hypothetical protein